MSKREENEYILGTDTEELHRLGLQHQVWAHEAHRGWKIANFTAGNTILDLGCGPGFCSKELAYIVGKEGKIIAVDKSKSYIDFLQKVTDLHSINIESIHADFDDLELLDNSLDGMYCRWALAWIPNPQHILEKVFTALKPGGKMVLHEYIDWATHSTIPSRPALSKAISACLMSFKEQPGNIDIGSELPSMLSNMGMKVTTRPMAKLGRPNEDIWQWPKSFYEIYFPKLVEMNYLSSEEARQALVDLAEIEQNPAAILRCPELIEVIAEK